MHVEALNLLSISNSKNKGIGSYASDAIWMTGFPCSSIHIDVYHPAGLLPAVSLLKMNGRSFLMAS